MIILAGALVGAYASFVLGSSAKLSETQLVIACLVGFVASTVPLAILLDSGAGRRLLTLLASIVRVILLLAIIGLGVWAWFQASS